MAHDNVEIVRDAYAGFRATRALVRDVLTPDFRWDMSHFDGWPEQQVYEGADGAEAFLREWVSAWEDWELEVQTLHAAGEKVVAILRQHGRSRATGAFVEMSFAQVWTMRDGKEARMEMYSDPREALASVGL
jgi:ketosteroid isomerase-like protein